MTGVQTCALPIYQVLVGRSGTARGEDGCPKICAYMIHGGYTQNAHHLIFAVAGCIGGKPKVRFRDTNKLSRSGAKLVENMVKLSTILSFGVGEQEDVIGEK